MAVADLGLDYSGNGNYWTPNNFSVTAGAGNDSLVDTPTPYGTDTGAGGEVRGNYATLNPLDKSASITLSNGNLDFASGAAGDFGARGNFFVSSGKWYFEFVQSNGVLSGQLVAVANASQSLSQANQHTSSSNLWGFQFADGQKTNGGLSSYGNAAAAGDVIGVALDMDNGRIWFSINGTWQASGNPASGTNAAFTNLSGQSVAPYYYEGNGAASPTGFFNFGQRPFAYTAPSGFKALCTTNLPTPTIGATSTTQANDYFNVALYTGNGSTQSITGVGFQPDFVWIKQRDAATYDHNLFDAVRGANKALFSNQQSAEVTYTDRLTSFDSDGFSLGSGVGTNSNGSTRVAWNWKANGAGSTNTAGTITSTVSANTTAGFSIVTYTGNGTSGATIGHGLGATPAFIITKSRSVGAYDWNCWFTGFANNDYIPLNKANAKASDVQTFDASGNTSTVFKVGNGAWINGNGTTYVAYCFAPVAGYSAFGSYTGNGSADGPFVYTGFRPRYVILKNSSAVADWWVEDTARDTYNTSGNLIIPNGSASEFTGSAYFIDFLSNGFKIRNTSTGSNGNTNTIIYAAFAESPFKYSLAR